jgi:hypothetical protein
LRRNNQVAPRLGVEQAVDAAITRIKQILNDS